MSRLSSIYRLDAVLKDGLLRVGGRLHKSAMPEEAKHPIILAKDQHISDLILKYIHQSLGHSGRAHTLSAARRRFWIAKGNSAVRKIIRECSFCRRYNGRLLEQKMADLEFFQNTPPSRILGLIILAHLKSKGAEDMALYLHAWQVERFIWRWRLPLIQTLV